MNSRRRLLSIAVLGCIFASCSGDVTPRERPLTGDEAATLASVQFANKEAGGSVFQVVASSTVTGETLSMSGVVDWERHSGRVTVDAQGFESPVTDIAWAGTQVLERRGDVAGLLPGLGFSADSWILRPLEPATRSIDRAIAILLKLSSTNQENALLIQQTEGSAWLRTDVLRDINVEVLRYGKQTIYWLESTTKALLRFEGNSASLTSPIIIDFIERGPQKISLPRVEDVIEVSRIKDLYGALTSP